MKEQSTALFATWVIFLYDQDTEHPWAARAEEHEIVGTGPECLAELVEVRRIAAARGIQVRVGYEPWEERA